MRAITHSGFRLVDSWFLLFQKLQCKVCIMRLQCPKHGTTISLQRVISQCLFMTPECNKPSNDLSILLPHSSNLFIVTGNYTVERLHHSVSRVCSGQEDVLWMFWELHPHSPNKLLWSLLILPRNRTALANLVPKLGTKQPRAMVNEGRNNHRGKHGNSYILYPEEKTDGIFLSLSK